jgi:hypothetical protein
LLTLQQVEVQVDDLPGATLGTTNGTVITIDADAAGYGWFVDATPGQDAEFMIAGDGMQLTARPGTPADGRMDLLTVIMHELGHVFGYGHDDDGVMRETLPVSARRLPGDIGDALDSHLGSWLDEMHNGKAVDAVFAEEMTRGH